MESNSVKREPEEVGSLNEEVMIKEETDNEENTADRHTNNRKSIGEGPSILRSMLLNPIWIEDKIRKKIQQKEVATKPSGYKVTGGKKNEFLDESILRSMLLNPIQIDGRRKKGSIKKTDDVVVIENTTQSNNQDVTVRNISNTIGDKNNTIKIIRKDEDKDVASKNKTETVTFSDEIEVLAITGNENTTGAFVNSNEAVSFSGKNEVTLKDKNDTVTLTNNTVTLSNKSDIAMSINKNNTVTINNKNAPVASSGTLIDKDDTVIYKNDTVNLSSKSNTITNSFKCKKRANSGDEFPVKKRNKGRMESTYQFGVVRIKPEMIENVTVVNDIERITNKAMVNITMNREEDEGEKIKFDVVNVKQEVNDDDDACETKPVEGIHRITIVDFKEENEDVFDENERDPLAENDASETLPPIPSRIAGEKENKKEDYDVYTRWKTEKGTFQCDQCNREIRSVYYFKIHRMKHFSEKIYSCDECQKSFVDLYTFKKHKELVHSVERPYICPVCTKTYKTQSELTVHGRVHTGEAPYYCGVCNKNFRHSSSFARHKRMHSGIKPHVCEYCDKGFAGLSNLQIHKRTHTGERPYECDVCNKKFICMDYLNAHKIVHIEGKTHKCSICEKMYKSRATLKQHQINIHGLKDVLPEDDDPLPDDNDPQPEHKSEIVDIKLEDTDQL